MKTAVISLLGLAAAINGQYVTKSIIYETEVNTITSCADYVTNCAVGHVSTTIHTKTTDCEKSTSSAAGYPVGTPSASTSIKYGLETSSSKPTTTPVAVPYTTSTVRITKEYTITSCAPTVTNCPVGAVTTTVIESTTVCPVAEATSKPYSPPVYVSSSKPYSPPVQVTTKAAVTTQAPVQSYPAPILSTLTISTCVPTVITSVITVTAAPTTKSPYTTVKPSAYPVPPKSNSTIEYTGSASTQRAGGLLVAALGLAAALL